MIQKSHYKKRVTIKLLKEMPTISFFAILANIFSAVAMGITPYFVSKTVNYAINNNATLTEKWIGYTFILMAIMVVLVVFEAVIKNIYSIRVERILRNNYSENVFLNNISDFKKIGKGAHWDNLTETANSISDNYFANYLLFIKSISTIIASFVAIALLNFYIALILAFICILSKIILVVFDKKLRVKTKAKADMRKKYNEDLNDLTLGIETLFWNDNIEALGEKIGEANSNVQKTSISFFKTEQIFKYVNALIAAIVETTLLVSISIFVFKINYSVVTLFLGIFMSLEIFQGELNNLVASFVAARQTKPLRDNPDYCKNKHAKKEVLSPWFEKEIKVQKLDFSYNDKEIFKDLSFNINKGEKIAITGKSGSGKSTLLNLILNQIKPNGGSILIDGNKIETIEEQKYLSNISYANNHNLIINETFDENMSLFGNATYKLKDLKEKFNLNFIKNKSDRLDKNALSTGQQQRVNLARVWINKKSILILDECFGNLDKKNADSILKNILEDKDVTIIMISHHLTVTQTKMFNKVIEL
ncbi:ABC transporter ATP-binding protein [Mycoplasma marinum]|uniref:ABC transporter ATP-binding protein n=1 Tax=Mycoplasma marinum TaxID=1937190 RepID=A0A4V2NI43_9MOLU|nr:ABC transporter ATP-binding protein [Mycoplasma marinum]TCG11438.1 hypothetical protein C4B24_02085 [Mycoplasma marinum]